MFDYDINSDPSMASKNQQVYGRETPPLYDLSLIKDCNIVLVCGYSDKVNQPSDYLSLANILRVCNSLGGIVETPFGHTSILNPSTD
jgi:hypothetical protein